MSTDDVTAGMIYREALITAAEIADECGAVLVAKKIREHARQHAAASQTVAQHDASAARH